MPSRGEGRGRTGRGGLAWAGPHLLFIWLFIWRARQRPRRLGRYRSPEAVNYAEFETDVSATRVSRIALVHDRVTRVVHGLDGFAVEHNPASGDPYLRPRDEGYGENGSAEPASLFVGTEKGFTCRLVLTPAEGGAAQLPIRNPDAAEPASHAAVAAGDPGIGALVRLIGMVVRREPLPGHASESGFVAQGLSGCFCRMICRWSGNRLRSRPPSGSAAIASNATSPWR